MWIEDSLCFVFEQPVRPHKPYEGKFKGKPRRACQQCGQWLDMIEGETRWYGWNVLVSFGERVGLIDLRKLQIGVTGEFDSRGEHQRFGPLAQSDRATDF